MIENKEIFRARHPNNAQFQRYSAKNFGKGAIECQELSYFRIKKKC